MARALLKRPNLLAYPGGLPGFDSSHIAASGIASNSGISAVASGGNFTNLLNAKAGSIAGAPIGAVKNIGPALTFASGADGVQFSGLSTALTPAYTVAAIAQFDGFGGYQGIFERDTGANGLLALNGAVIIYNGGDVSSGFTPALNTPYFIAFSGNNNVVAGVGSYNFVIVNLRNGSVFTASGTQVGGWGPPGGTCQIGNNSGQPTNGKIAAVMYSPSLMSLPQMLQWAQDPWAFWYPQKFDLLAMLKTAAGGGSIGAAAGTGAASALGASIAASVASAAGLGAAPGVGASTAAAIGSAAGVGAATAVGIGVTAGVGSSAGIGSATAVGASTAAAIGNAAGVGAAAAVGASTAAAVGAAAGTGAAAATSFTGNIGTASGIGAAAGVGASIVAAVGVATGIGAAAAASGSGTPSETPSTASGGSGFATGPYTGPFRRRKKKKTEDEELDELAELLRAAPKAAPAIYKPIVYQGPLAAIFYEPIATIEQRRTTPAVNEIMARAKAEAQRREDDDEEALKLLEARRLEIIKEVQDLLMLL